MQVDGLGLILSGAKAARYDLKVKSLTSTALVRNLEFAFNWITKIYPPEGMLSH